MPGELKVSAVEALIKPWCRGNLVAGRAERWPRWSLGLGGVGWRRRRDPGSGQFAAEDPRISSICPVVWKEKMRSVIMAREQAELWKTRDNGGKAAWLFIGVLSSVYWVSDVITDDELAVLIMRACSSRNLFVKHHLLTTLFNPELILHFCLVKTGFQSGFQGPIIRQHLTWIKTFHQICPKTKMHSCLIGQLWLTFLIHIKCWLLYIYR